MKKSKGPKREHWTAEEDRAIKSIVNDHGPNWKLVALKLSKDYGISGKTRKQCRERWVNHLDESITKSPWTAQEETILFAKQEELGNKWEDISTSFIGRPANSVKNHFYSLLRKQFRREFGGEPSNKELKDREKELALAIRQKLSEIETIHMEFYIADNSILLPPPNQKFIKFD